MYVANATYNIINIMPTQGTQHHYPCSTVMFVLYSTYLLLGNKAPSNQVTLNFILVPYFLSDVLYITKIKIKKMTQATYGHGHH